MAAVVYYRNLQVLEKRKEEKGEKFAFYNVRALFCSLSFSFVRFVERAREFLNFFNCCCWRKFEFFLSLSSFFYSRSQV